MLKTHMKIDDVIQFCFFEGVVVCKQCFHIAMYVCRLDGFLVAYFVGQALVVANSEPRLLAVRGVGFEDELGEGAGERFTGREARTGSELSAYKADGSTVATLVEVYFHLTRIEV